MARTTTEEMICDVCGTNRDVESFTVVRAEGARVIDLCTGDAKATPVMVAWLEGSGEPRRKMGRDGKPRATSHAVIPVD